jgi:putative beta-lysine N-acetyltransferase
MVWYRCGLFPTGKMMHDSTESLLGATVHHGPLNQRAYLTKLGDADAEAVAAALDELAVRRNYGKILARVPTRAAAVFLKRGYRVEARIPGFYRGRRTALFLARYPNPARARERDPKGLETVVNLATEYKSAANSRTNSQTETAVPCGPEDAGEMAAVFRRVFRSYPYPVFDPKHLAAVMAGPSRYFCIRRRRAIAALAAAEMDSEESCVEMTDFAVLPEYRGGQMAVSLLARMQREAVRTGMRTAFTIARTRSTAINAVFARRGYRHAGTLTNNTHISGVIQSMAVWYKSLPPCH